MKALKVERKNENSSTFKTIPYKEFKQILLSNQDSNGDEAKKNHISPDAEKSIFKSKLSVPSSNLKFWVT